jgi:hypothetical protein
MRGSALASGECFQCGQVGRAATPNRMGAKGYNGPGKDYTAYLKDYRYKTDSKRTPAPIPLQNCPWCGTLFQPGSFRLIGDLRHPTDLRVQCMNPRCEFNGGARALPIVTVDEPIYRRLPAFLIATVDKFAALPWTGETGALFGHVSRYDEQGFYGPCSRGKGRPLGAPLPPPGLIIQDELHLISGPRRLTRTDPLPGYGPHSRTARFSRPSSPRREAHSSR